MPRKELLDRLIQILKSVDEQPNPGNAVIWNEFSDAINENMSDPQKRELLRTLNNMRRGDRLPHSFVDQVKQDLGAD